VEPSCSHCAARRFAHLDCGFRGRNPIPHPSGSDFAVEVVSSVGDFRLDPQGHVLRLPYHRDVLFTASGVVTLASKSSFGGGEGAMAWSEPSRCELLPLRGDIEAPFVAHDQSIRGWLGGRMVLRTSDGAWQLATEDPSPSSLSALAPHAVASGLDARVWYVPGPITNTYRILAQRWGFPPVVIFETEEHVQPVVRSIAPPPVGAGPRAPVVLLTDGIRLVAGDNGSSLRKTGMVSLHVPDLQRGYRQVDLRLGDQDHECEETFDEHERHPRRGTSDFTSNVVLVRTSDDSLWMLARRHHSECEFILDRDASLDRRSAHQPPPRMWHGKELRQSDVLEIYAVEADGSSSRRERIDLVDPLEPTAQDAGVTALEAVANGTSVLAISGGLGVWLDLGSVSR
jgi:hypothetical protein